ncbi:hypothetical protein [Enterococcus faecalis]|uniref:hypothetical protein n=1 Tax=Enterococcus faecalis TaxID=1351 RepID=UPI00045B30AB|nr:hypothetical protein [Enterococcus faecalis]KAJ79914.1 hypothetical protein P788_1051 [Enterococcus faecalis MTUP9]
MSQITDRLKGLDTLKKIDKDKAKYLVIHYSCESFYDLGGKSPRITSIAVQNLEFGQTELFAIYKSAEEMGKSFDEISKNYNEIEKKMLDKYFDYLKNNQNRKWLHWDMRDSIFGFKALEHRYQVLGGNPFVLPDNQKINIASLFKEIYGPNYIEDKKMDNLMKKNDLKPKYYLTGADEATAFEKEQYYELSVSTSSKVRMFTQMINMAIDRTLKTNTSKKELYGRTFFAHWYRFKEKPYFVIVLFVVTNILSAFISYFVTKGLGG